MMEKTTRKTRAEIARLREQNYSCSQATMLGICRALGSSLTEEQIMALSAGFRGGIGRSYNEGTCGALSAGIMVLGMFLPEENEKTIALSKELFDHFKKEYKTVICGNIVQKHGFSRCTGCCFHIGDKVEELLQRENARIGTAHALRRNDLKND
ncbi:C-GCAxxG-C-C family protein [Bacteroides fragilis]